MAMTAQQQLAILAEESHAANLKYYEEAALDTPQPSAPGVDGAITDALSRIPNGQAGESTDYCRGWRDALDYVQTLRGRAQPSADDARDAVDARRYRWLRDNAAVAESVMAHNKGHRRAILEFEAPDLDLDAAIDRAMGGES